VAGEPFELCWEPRLRTLFVRRSAEEPEQALKVRTSKLRQFAGELFTEVRLEYGDAQGKGMGLLRSEWALQAPGQQARKSSQQLTGEKLRSPMVGRVLRVLVEPEQRVVRDQELLVIEAMKMENRIHARASGVIKCLLVQVGEQVSMGQLLLQISGEDDHDAAAGPRTDD
jgi:biotin carboxyl carrier protein